MEKFVSVTNPKVIEAIINAGGRVNAGADIGRTPLHEAAKWNKNSSIIFTLINNGADILASDHKGSNIFEIIESNAKLKSTDGYWDVRELQFK